jgi:hypothetical protein
VDVNNEGIKEIISLSDESYFSINLVLFFMSFSALYLLQNIMETYYIKTRGKIVKLGSLFRFGLNIAQFIVFIIWLIKYLNDYAIYNIKDVRIELVRTSSVLRIMNDKTFDVYAIFAIFIFIQWFRSLSALEISRLFGPLIKIVVGMIKDCI